MFDIPIDFIRVSVAIIMLGIATASDIKKREINDIVWIIFGGAGAALLILSSDLNEDLLKVGIALIVAPIALLIWRVGLFGGADAFALIALAVIAPGMTLFGDTVMPFSTLTNAVLLSIIPMIINVVRNTALLAARRDIFEGFEETKTRKILAMFIGYRAANPKFGFSIEKIQGKKKKLKLSFHHAESTQFCEKKDTWITPGIPYMIFITAGFVVQLVYGDMLAVIFRIF